MMGRGEVWRVKVEGGHAGARGRVGARGAVQAGQRRPHLLGVGEGVRLVCLEVSEGRHFQAGQRRPHLLGVGERRGAEDPEGGGAPARLENKARGSWGAVRERPGGGAKDPGGAEPRHGLTQGGAWCAWMWARDGMSRRGKGAP